jgi:uncharacterized protein YjbI with pentapeptide repeats
MKENMGDNNEINWDPFEVVIEEDSSTTLCLHGEEGKRKLVSVDKTLKILEAIKNGWNIDIRYADIKGDINISRSGLSKDKTSRYVISGDIGFYEVTFIKDVSFAKVIFSGNVLFIGATFNGIADFIRTIFNESVNFTGAIFDKGANFTGAIFDKGANFSRVNFNDTAIFLIVEFCDNSYFSGAIFSEDVDFSEATFSGWANFVESIFSKSVDFIITTFNKSVVFYGTTFSEDVDFSRAIFSEDVDFSEVIFGKYVCFNGVRMLFSADFSRVRFSENTVSKGLLNLLYGEILFLAFGWIILLLLEWEKDFGPKLLIWVKRYRWKIFTHIWTRIWKKRFRWKATEFSMNTEKVMDASTNPYLKRYIEDELWIDSWKNSSWIKKFLFFFWELTSHCGRSFVLWLFWSKGCIGIKLNKFHKMFHISRDGESSL